MESRSVYYYGVDGVRLLAALIVALFHVGFSCWANPMSGGAQVWRNSYMIPGLAPFIWFGWIGVEIFFVISGLVIASSAENASPRSFLQGRASRLYPAVWICGTITFVFLMSIGIRKIGFRYVVSMILFPTGPFIDGQYWTLGVELVFYACVLGLLLLKRYKWISIFALLMAIYSVVFMLVLFRVPSLLPLTKGSGRLALFTYGPFFALGIALRDWAASRTSILTKAIFVSGGLGAALEIRIHVNDIISQMKNSPISIASYWYVPYLIFAGAFALISASIKFRDEVAGLPQGAIRALRRGGLITYPLYLLHFSLGIGATRALILHGAAPATALVVVVIALVVAAFIVAQFAEPPIRKALQRGFRTGDRKSAA